MNTQLYTNVLHLYQGYNTQKEQYNLILQALRIDYRSVSPLSEGALPNERTVPTSTHSAKQSSDSVPTQ